MSHQIRSSLAMRQGGWTRMGAALAGWRGAARWMRAGALTLTLVCLPLLSGCIGNCQGTHTINELAGVFAISASDAWAVGGASSDSGTMAALIEHWDGSRWSVVPNPALEFGGAYYTGAPLPLRAVAGASSQDIWAVGKEDSRNVGPVIEHWDGHLWRVSSAPCVNPCVNAQLNAITVLSASDAWAVGSVGAPGGTSPRPLVERWDGTSWAVAPGVDSIASRNAVLDSVVALSDADVWVFGVEGYYAPLIAHWDGKRWQAVANKSGAGAIHLPLVAYNTPVSAAVAPAGDSSGKRVMWMVGVTYSSCTQCKTPLILKGSGKNWGSIPADQLPAEPGAAATAQMTIQAIGAVASDDVWIVGSYWNSGQPSQGMTGFIARWDGARWTSLPRMQRQTGDTLESVSAISATDAWAVGESGKYGNAAIGTLTLVERWNGSQWRVIPSPSPGAPVRNICM